MALNPFRLAYALLAAIVVAGGVLFYAQAAPMLQARSSCSAPAPSRDPLVATRQFVETAVARVHVERSFGLVTPALRQGMSCAEWMTGTIPVQPFLEMIPTQSRYRVVQRSHGQRIVLVHLVSRSRDWGETTFMLELHETGGGWFASSWTPAGAALVPAAV
jgi:hypothetical protein